MLFDILADDRYDALSIISRPLHSLMTYRHIVKKMHGRKITPPAKRHVKVAMPSYLATSNGYAGNGHAYHGQLSTASKWAQLLFTDKPAGVIA